MAKRGPQAAAKRARELRREQRKEDKRERRANLTTDEELSEAERTSLMEEFADLNARLENNTIDRTQFETERHRIFVALGLESGDED